MDVAFAHRQRVAPPATAARVIAAVFVDEIDHDAALVSLPRPELHLVVRFGPSARGGLDAHAFGARDRAHRKLIRAGQRAVMVRLHLGTSQAVLGVPAAAIVGRIVALDTLWGDAATRTLLDQLAAARTTHDAAAIFGRAIAERVATAAAPHSALALAAADRLAAGSVGDVAADLGVSERHLRRVFHDAVGVSPKTFARLARFHRALGAARQGRPASWASIAAAAGYYDQAHLIGEFRAIAGVTPRALLVELGSVGPDRSGRDPVRDVATESRSFGR